MELLSRVQIVRESIATITQILAERDIPVHQEGLKAYVQFNEVTGEPVKVGLPYLPDDASEDLILSVQGFLDHEVGHLLFTDRKALLEIAHDAQLLEMQNIFEDPYVERKMRDRFPGSRENFNRLYDFFIGKVVDRNYEKLIKREETNPMAYFGVLFPCIARAWADFDVFVRYMEDKWDLVEPIVKKIDPALIARVPFTKTTRENIEIGREMLLQIMQVDDDTFASDDDEFEAPSEEESSADPSGEGGSGGSGRPARSKRRGIVDEEGDESEKEPEGIEEGDESEEEGESDPSDTTSDTEESEESDEGEEGSAGAESEEESEEGSAGKESEESEEESAADVETGSKFGGGGKESDDVSEKEVGDEEKKGDGKKPGSGDESSDTWKPSSDTEFLDHSIGDMDSSMSEEIESMAVESARKSEYLIPTTDHDLVEIAPIVGRERFIDEKVKKIDDQVADMVNVIQSDFERAFVSEQRSHWRGSQTRGRINPSQLSRLRTGDVRVFRKKEIHRTQDFDVQLVIDCSGSMSGSRINLACQAAYAMGMALSRIGINFEIIGFTSRGHITLGEERHARPSGIVYARRDAIYMPVFKDFSEQWSPQVMQRLATWAALDDYGYLRENVDGESLMIAARRLAAQKSPGKAMIVLSDGSPACSSEDREALSRHLRKTTKVIQNANIHLVGIGIQHEGVSHYFDNYSVIHSLNDLPIEVISKIREIILG
ncbi:cobaltochelatase CobT-related protein [Vibrio fluvialis]|uniref:cobaltochelatase CobT-related protein n=1 Tax=Vibrio fluvialis TaxID=676 RepID=UPI003D0FA9EC